VKVALPTVTIRWSLKERLDSSPCPPDFDDVITGMTQLRLREMSIDGEGGELES
jgi:hypothetical protein